MMQFRELVTNSRSYRRFDGSYPVSEEVIRDLVELACYTPSAKNLQPLKFIPVCDPETAALLYPLLSWAGYLADWPGPAEGERPPAYIVMLGDKEISQDFGPDSGIAAQTILLGATASGLGGCIIAALDRNRIKELLKIPERFSILLVLALGKPQETVVIDQMTDQESVRYYRDRYGVHHVPKRMLDEVLLKFH
ncbi:nitroreductase family protein [Chlorobium ferrooxidans]|uniref:Nitroreductase n=1 Tax=Chlorobium ferrooxidans DSM 13031 TaxID=377431 RepID=Q0YUQ3_9CHLB|nr:Nitroreductase [Chlorobium ferrooxidans DSM 13031]